MILRNAAESWPARQKWSFEYLRREHGLANVSMMAVKNANASALHHQEHKNIVTLPLGAYLDLISNEETHGEYYLAKQPIRRRFAGMQADIPAVDYLRVLPGRFLPPNPTLWIGPRGTITPLHFDRVDNLFFQLLGRKRFVLFSPEQSDRLYYPDRAMRNTYSPVNVEHPDWDLHPRFREARALVGQLEAGDAIYVPRTWFHSVRSLDRNVSVNFWRPSYLDLTRVLMRHLVAGAEIPFRRRERA